MKNQQVINVTLPEHKETVRMLDRMSSRINGVVTVGKLSNFVLALPVNSRPSEEFIKAYVKYEKSFNK